MKRLSIVIMLGMIALNGTWNRLAEGASVTLSPASTALVTAEGTTDTEVVAAFNLSALAGAQVDLAVVEWSPAGMTVDSWTEYELVPILAAWTAGGLAGGASLSLAGDPAATWEFFPMDYERNGKGLIRFDVTELVSSWVLGTATNNGFAIRTDHLARETAGSAAGSMSLTVTYLPEQE